MEIELWYGIMEFHNGDKMNWIWSMCHAKIACYYEWHETSDFETTRDTQDGVVCIASSLRQLH